MKDKENYHLAIDGMRIVAILAVVLIHCTTRILEASSFDIRGQLLAFTINQSLRFAVPLFLMISGFVLEVNYSFHENYLSYLKKRFSRIFVPYIFWSFIYFFLVYRHHTITFLEALVNGSSSYQLYFIPSLILFYLIFPVFHKMYRIISFWPILVTLGILQVWLLIMDYYFHLLKMPYPLAIVLLNYLVFIMGMMAARHHRWLYSTVTKWKLLLLITEMFLVALVSFEGMSLYIQNGNYLYFYSSWRPSVLIYTLVSFSLLYGSLSKVTIPEKITRKLSGLSFFVFFIHVAILEISWNLVSRYNWALFVLFTIGMSLSTAYLSRRFPLSIRFFG